MSLCYPQIIERLKLIIGFDLYQHYGYECVTDYYIVTVNTWHFPRPLAAKILAWGDSFRGNRGQFK